MNSLRKQFVAFAFVCLAGLPAVGDELPGFSGKVVYVKDGDSIIVMHGTHREEIRLNAVDCPEKNQPFGDKATDFTSSQCLDKVVSIKTFGPDVYGRTIGDVTLEDGRKLNNELVRTGHAWWFRKYAPDNKELQKLETEAREKHLGLWQEENPIAPWDWRHHRMQPFVQIQQQAPAEQSPAGRQ